MKLSISLADDDLAIVDEYARAKGLPSRSAVLQHAIRLLRLPDLEDDYATAWQDWQDSGDFAAWEGTSGDGIIDAAR